MISIHVLRVEDDLESACIWPSTSLFQSTSSVWRTTVPGLLRRGRPCISIHVLRVEDDSTANGPWWAWLYFNPRPPCGGRHKADILLGIIGVFQSTSSVWRTTFRRWCESIGVGNFNPRPPCGGRLLFCVSAANATAISIHVLRVEDDKITAKYQGNIGHFNPRPPCGGRLYHFALLQFSAVFQSTSSVWRTTQMGANVSRGRIISIHVLRVEDEESRKEQYQSDGNFNPRPPCGGRPSSMHPSAMYGNFNPRPPCGGRLT